MMPLSATRSKMRYWDDTHVKGLQAIRLADERGACSPENRSRQSLHGCLAALAGLRERDDALALSDRSLCEESVELMPACCVVLCRRP